MATTTSYHLQRIRFNTNQNSTFFRFPGEIRNKIYAYALGGYNLICSRYNADGTSRPHFVPLPFDTKPKARLGLNLLQVCRQIYLEAYLFPFQCNTFYFKDRQRQLTDRRLLRPYQRYAITKIDLAAFRWRGQGLHISSKLLSGTLRPHLPALKHVRIRILTPNLNEANLEGACESALLNLLGKEDPDGVEVSAVYAHKYEELA